MGSEISFLPAAHERSSTAFLLLPFRTSQRHPKT